jgi:biopolymer transport protein ExbB
MNTIPMLTLAAESKSILGYIHAGGPISYLLVLISIAAVALVVINIVLLRRESLAPEPVVDGLRRLIAQNAPAEAIIAFCRQQEHDCFLARIIAGGLGKVSRSAFGLLELRPALEEAGARELDRLERTNHIIAMIAAVGPMLGLLGTVVGMIGAFATLGAESGITKNEQLAGYMSVALVTTAEGLIIAIPCTFAYALFKRRTDRLVAEVGDTAEELLSALSANAKTAARAARPPAPGTSAA